MGNQRMVLRNALNGETFIFSGPLDAEDAARFDVVLERGGSGGGNAIEHVHPCAEERFTVRSGRIEVVIAGKAHALGPGEQAAVPAGQPHYFINAYDGVTELTVEFSPPQRHLRFFANFASLTQKRPEWFSAKGDAPLLLIALVLHAYRDHLYLARLPVRVQKLMFAALAPLARLLGYALEIEPKR
jgi:mannose-6-phosphate isomerase-like protein (cupin superfamily)